MKITVEQIFKAVPHADHELVGKIVAAWHYAEENGIVTPRDTAFFLGHAAVETAGFTRLEENLFYTTTARLRAVWPTRFKTDKAADPYIRNPKALANLVYGGRLGNERDGTADDDGWEKRGSGLFQTTGEANFEVVEKATGLPVTKHPEMLRAMPTALEAAAIFWRVNKLGDLTNRPDAIAATTKRIQGGTGGLVDRTIYINRFLSMFAVQPPNGTALRRGSKGPRVQALQMVLRDLGHYGGAIDGDFGPGTEQAVRDFQADRSIHPVDGVVGPLTFTALDAE